MDDDMLIIAPAPRPDHVRNADLRAEKGSIQVKFHHAPELFFRRLGHRSILKRRTAGIVVQNGKSAKPVDSFRKGRLDHRLIANITVDEMRVPSGIFGSYARGLGGSLAARRIDFRDHDLRPLFCKPFRGRPADTAASAGDECNFACKARHETFLYVMFLIAEQHTGRR